MVDKALEYVKEVFETDYSGHDYFHTFRVYKMATNIAIQEKAIAEQRELYMKEYIAEFMNEWEGIK